MTHKAIRYTPSAVLKFSLIELKLMIKCSELHYDGVCREASAERISHLGNRPGFLRGMYNCRKNAGARWEHVLTFRELDTLAKILEQGHLVIDNAGVDRLVALQFGIRKALRAINDHTLDDVMLENQDFSPGKLRLISSETPSSDTVERLRALLDGIRKAAADAGFSEWFNRVRAEITERNERTLR